MEMPSTPHISLSLSISCRHGWQQRVFHHSSYTDRHLSPWHSCSTRDTQAAAATIRWYMGDGVQLTFMLITTTVPDTYSTQAVEDFSEEEDDMIPEDAGQSMEQDVGEGSSTAVRVKKIGKKKGEKLRRKEQMRQYHEVCQYPYGMTKVLIQV